MKYASLLRVYSAYLILTPAKKLITLLKLCDEAQIKSTHRRRVSRCPIAESTLLQSTDLISHHNSIEHA